MAEKSPPLRILVVDDEPLVRWSFGQALGAAGHAVIEASDAKAALRAFARAPTPFDVVLLDYRLPDSTDLGLLSTLKRLAPSSQIILMSAYSTAVARDAVARGAYRVISKPVDMQDLADLVLQAHASGPW